MKKIAFIIGYPRSGTTMLATMLSRHSAICTMGETHFFLTTNLFPLFRHTYNWWNNYINHNRRFKMIDFRLSDNTDLKKKLSASEYFTCYAESYREHKGAAWFVEKSPTHIDVLPSIRSAYPNAPIINIVRDVRDTTASMLNASWANNSPIKHVAEWKAVQRRTKRFKDFNGMNILNVRYEDLLANPELELTRILKHIDPALIYSDSLLNDTAVRDAIPECEKAWKEKAGHKPDLTRQFAWKKKSEPWHRYAALCNDELAIWGYELQPKCRLSFIDKLLAFIYVTPLYRNLRVLIKSRTLYDR
ncbi:sulfotransferase [Thalassolituus sp.]|jgi:hypothetical protein|uniref:sulfotransferase family protein n=1 Tax=Thalassolituus sp. TaxID=2030822 RepID=UPI0032D93629